MRSICVSSHLKAVRALVVVFSLVALPNLGSAQEADSGGRFNGQAEREESPIDLVAEYHMKYSHLPDAEIARLNREELDALARDTAPRKLPNGRLGLINVVEANQIAKWRYDHPVVGPAHHDSYDPEGRIGFCFGRAMAVHLELLSRGVSKDSIRKVFITPSAGRDHFHVVTAVRGPAGIWWAFDGRSTPEKLEDWVARWGSAVGPKMKVTVTESSKFAGQAGRYARLQFANGNGVDGFYNNYFLNLLATFRKEALKTRRFDGSVKSCKAIFAP